jgi:hypothetical protein
MHHCIRMYGLLTAREPVGATRGVLVYSAAKVGFWDVLFFFKAWSQPMNACSSIGFSLGLAMVSVNMGGCE